MSEHEELQQVLETANGKNYGRRRGEQPSPPKSNEQESDFSQWRTGPNDSYMACSGTRQILPSGVYRTHSSEHGIVFAKTKILTDTLIEFDDHVTHEILQGIRKFWNSEDEFTKRGILYKRGVLLWGLQEVARRLA